MKKKWLPGFILILLCGNISAQEMVIREKKMPGYFSIVPASGATAIYVDKKDYWLMQRVAVLLQQDLEMITGRKPPIVSSLPSSADNIILIGSIDSSEMVRGLASKKKIDVSGLQGQWEKFRFQTIAGPAPGIQQALVIFGSDKRGTAYGVMELSKQMGLSPWYWWADVPAKKKKEIYFKNGLYTYGSPSVKYRGIFINDEAPAFSGWTKEKFGGFNHRVYEKVFELLLRLKANYLWPAMWGNAFNDDDTLNPVLAQQYGIVMGTSHHEPMLRAQEEWKRYGKGAWNYDSNETVLKAFWKKGIENMGTHESIVTIGMRGDGDMPMTEGSNIALLERIVKDQRKILTDVTGKQASETPQLWALYKEVQAYYDKGMTVPDDVTLLLCDDNWGNLRKLPRLNEKPRAGGYGIYYHFDYVGDPRNYKWLNTNSIPRVWEQMNLAKQYGADRIWIVNVGDLKPMEYPIDFFLDFAWDTKKWTAGSIADFPRQWAENIFGKTHAKEIGKIIAAYTKYNSRRKPELLSPETYSLTHYLEAETIERDYNQLAERAESIYRAIAPAYKNAFDQLVRFPVLACANINSLYISAGRNHLYASQGRRSTNDEADSVKKFFERDQVLCDFYNAGISAGKWNHMMDQTHIGYTYWQQPEKNEMPEVKYIVVPDRSEAGLAVEGSDAWWPGDSANMQLPEFDSYMKRSHYIELFNRGTKPFSYFIEPSVSWITTDAPRGEIINQQRIVVKTDWEKVPAGIHKIPIYISTSNGERITVFAVVKKYTSPEEKRFSGFVETNGYVCMEAGHYTRAIDAPPVHWQMIPDIGRTGAGMAIVPVTAKRQDNLNEQSPRLEFQMMLFDTGRIKIQMYFSPTLNFHGEVMKYAVSLDDGIPLSIALPPYQSGPQWEQWVAENIISSSSELTVPKAGKHILKFWMIDPGLVLQKIVVGFREVKDAYLGPPETFINHPAMIIL